MAENNNNHHNEEHHSQLEEESQVLPLIAPPEDNTEVAPPKREFNWRAWAYNYGRSLIPPIIYWLPKYNRTSLRGDIIAGTTVGVILIPQGMAYSSLAGLPPIYGLYAAIIAPLIYALFGTSMRLTLGPVAITALLTASGVKALAPATHELYIEAAIVLGFMSGLILLIMGFLRFGFVVDFLSNTVLTGFISASAFVIIVSQLKDILGITTHGDTFLLELYDVFTHLKEVNGWAILGSILCLALLFGIKQVKRVPKWVPVELLLMLVAILISWAANLDKTIKTVGNVPSGLPPFTLPRIAKFNFATVLNQAFIIALISYIGSIALARAFAKQGEEINANQELIAQGAAGFLGAFFSGHPVSGSFSRTAINSEMGACTPLAGLITASVVSLVLLLLTPIFKFLPKLVLASIVVVSVRNLIDYKEAIYLWKVNKSEFAVLIATSLCTLLIGIDTGIIASIFISLIAVLLRTSRPRIVPLGRLPKSIIYRNALLHPHCITYPNISIFRMEGDIYFANISNFRQHVLDLAKKEGLIAIIVDAVSINYVDAPSLRVLQTLVDDLEKRNISLVFASAHAIVRDTFAYSGISKKLKLPPKVHIHQAVQYFLQKVDHPLSSSSVNNDTEVEMVALDEDDNK